MSFNRHQDMNVYATQGGGRAVKKNGDYVFTVAPKWAPHLLGQKVPDEWDVQVVREGFSDRNFQQN